MIDFESEILLIIKTHPNQNINYLKKIVAEFPVKNYLFISTVDTNELIYHSDVIIGIYSNFLVEAEKLKKNILRHIPNPNNEDSLDHLKSVKISHNVDDLASNIKLYL